MNVYEKWKSLGKSLIHSVFTLLELWKKILKIFQCGLVVLYRNILYVVLVYII